jgi:hypothetical protein
MPRRNKGPRLYWHRNRDYWYIAWTERGRSRERSTGTADREQRLKSSLPNSCNSGTGEQTRVIRLRSS